MFLKILLLFNMEETRLIETKMLSTLNNNRKNRQDNSFVNVLSYLDMKPRKMNLHKILSEGSYNTIFSLINSKKRIEKKLIIRLSKKKVSFDGIKMELKGIKIQYKLSNKSLYIGRVIDYGRIILNNDRYHQEYSILEKYGVSLKYLLEKTNRYTNILVPLDFMKKFLQTIHIIHTSGHAHLDLKPSNILLQNINGNKRVLDNLDFAIIDFGASGTFKNDKSKFIKKQMASAAFSPPELIQRKFGKKNDIWAFGVISYLVLVNKFFFKANGIKMFINEDKNIIAKNIKNTISNLRKNILPIKLKNSIEISQYLQHINSDYYLDTLKDFFLQVFTIDPVTRPNTSELLNHPLFKI